MRKLLLVISLIIGSSVQAAERPVLLVVGDSLSAAYGIDGNDGWVSLLQAKLLQNRYPHRVINASISGDTTRGALTRLPRALEQHRPEVVIIELGGNDGLRGISLQEMQSNLTDMVHMSQRQNAKVLLLGMRLPPNYGPAFTKRFHAIYHTVADRAQIALVPFFLEGVATDRALMQADGVHPTAAAQPRLLDNVWPQLQPLLTPSVTAR